MKRLLTGNKDSWDGERSKWYNVLIDEDVIRHAPFGEANTEYVAKSDIQRAIRMGKSDNPRTTGARAQGWTVGYSSERKVIRIGCCELSVKNSAVVVRWAGRKSR